jgi:hypothetical protein
MLRVFVGGGMRISEARFVRIEGLDKPCLLLAEGDALPDEIVVDFRKSNEHWAHERRGPVTFRLQPSSVDDPEPSYVEVFDD